MSAKSELETAAATQSLVLLAHGSIDRIWSSPFERLLARIERRVGAGRVRLAYLQFGRPTLLEAVQQAMGEACFNVAVLPVFLAAGAHVARDVPALIGEARLRFPALTISLLPPIGEDARVQALFEHIACEYLLGGNH